MTDVKIEDMTVKDLMKLLSQSNAVQGVENLTSSMWSGFKDVKELFLEHKLPVEATRDPQVAIAVMQFRTAGMDILKRIIETAYSYISARAEIQIIEAKLKARALENSHALEMQKGLPAGTVNIAGQSITIDELVTRLNTEVPESILKAFMAGGLSGMLMGFPGAVPNAPSSKSMQGTEEDDYDDYDDEEEDFLDDTEDVEFLEDDDAYDSSDDMP